MKQIPVSLSELYNRRLPLGRVGENVHVQIVFQCNAIFADYPNATTKLVVTAPGGESYAPEIEKSGTNILWTVTDSDLAKDGGGEVQLTFRNGNEKIKSYIGKTQIFRSLAENGKVPTPIENWIEKAEETVRQMAQEAAEATVEDLADTKEACIEEIEQAGEDTRDSIPADYTKLSNDVIALNNALSILQPSATASDVGKVLRAKSVSNGKVTEYELGNVGGLSEDVKQALLDCFQHVVWLDGDGQEYYEALEGALYPPVSPERITAVYTQSGTVYDNASLNDLKPDLVVIAHYTDASTSTVTNYTLSGTLVAGTSTITVSYGGKTTTFMVTVTAIPTIQSISAVYGNSNPVYNTDSIDDLKTDLTVTAIYTDGTEEPVTDYTLSGTMSGGNQTITVTYAGKTTTFTVEVYKFGFVKGILSGQADNKACIKTNTARICAGSSVGDIPMNYESGSASPIYAIPLRSGVRRIYVSNELSEYRKAYIFLTYDQSVNDYIQAFSSGWLTDQSCYIDTQYRSKDYLMLINISGATGTEDMSNVDTTDWSAYYSSAT